MSHIKNHRATLIKLAATLNPGSPERKAILAGLVGDPGVDDLAREIGRIPGVEFVEISPSKTRLDVRLEGDREVYQGGRGNRVIENNRVAWLIPNFRPILARIGAIAKGFGGEVIDMPTLDRRFKQVTGAVGYDGLIVTVELRA